jgi:hypothetical protein
VDPKETGAEETGGEETGTEGTGTEETGTEEDCGIEEGVEFMGFAFRELPEGLSP